MNSKLFEIYLIVNTSNQMKYVGVTCRDLEVRFREHVYSSSTSKSQAPLHVAMRIFGPENFTIQSVLKDITISEARIKEVEYIKKYDSLEPKGYNTYRAGMGGHLHTEAGRSNISKGLEGHVFSKERNQKVKEAMQKRDYKSEWSENLSAVRKGKFAKEENGFYGKHHKQETLRKIQESRLSSAGKIIECVLPDGEILEFRTFKDAGQYVLDNALATTPRSTCSERISRNCRSNSNKFFYGGVWRFQERSID